jgi:hypothetical protein
VTTIGEQSVLVFGSGRSGTTWVQDVLAEANGFGTLFEPLHPEAVRGARDFANLYLRPGEDAPALKGFMDQVMSGTLKSIWATLRARPDRLSPSAKNLGSWKAIRYTKAAYVQASRRWWHNRRFAGRPRIIKFIRANLMLEWLIREYGLKSALIVRHPCAVLSSVLRRSGPEWGAAAMTQLLNRYLGQPNLVEDRLLEVEDRLKSLRSVSEIHAAIWCIENGKLLADDNPNGVVLAHYEDLITNTSSWQSLVDGLRLSVTPTDEALLRPSQQARYGMGSRASAEVQISSWQSQLTEKQKQEVRSVLDLFGVRAYSVNDPLPLKPMKPGA